MIVKVTIENFFSFGNSQVIELNKDTNILVGINGSGKSNFIKAIRLLYECTAGIGMEKLILREWGGFQSIVNFSDKHIQHISITYEFEFKNLKKGNLSYEITIQKFGILGSYGISELIYQSNNINRIYLEKNANGFRVSLDGKIFASSINKIENYSETALWQFIPVFLSESSLIKETIKNTVVYSYFDTTPTSPIRQLSPFYSEKNLLPTGENLAYLLNELNNNDVDAYNMIISELQNINPNVQSLGFQIQGAGKIYLTLKEKGLSRTIPIEHISDGTLRLLLLLSIFYNPKRGSIICIDEPETGLHPDMIKTVAKAIKYAAKTSQIIVATHSPLLLNAFEIEDVKIFEKNENNESVVVSKSESDFEDWNDEFLVGQLWLRGRIGGTRW